MCATARCSNVLFLWFMHVRVYIECCVPYRYTCRHIWTYVGLINIYSAPCVTRLRMCATARHSLLLFFLVCICVYMHVCICSMHILVHAVCVYITVLYGMHVQSAVASRVTRLHMCAPARYSLQVYKARIIICMYVCVWLFVYISVSYAMLVQSAAASRLFTYINMYIHTYIHTCIGGRWRWTAGPQRSRGFDRSSRSCQGAGTHRRCERPYST
jgi:hypothetical protein